LPPASAGGWRLQKIKALAKLLKKKFLNGFSRRCVARIWLKPIGKLHPLNSAKATCEFQTIPPAKAGGNLKETASSANRWN
jgi:hypothetical protein